MGALGSGGKKKRGFWRSLVLVFPQQEWPLPLILQHRAEGWRWGVLRMHPQQKEVTHGVRGEEAGVGDRLTHTREGDRVLAVGSPCLPLPTWVVSTGLVCSQNRHRDTHLFSFLVGYYLPVTKERETSQQTLEESPLLVLRMVGGQQPNTLCALMRETPISWWGCDGQGNLLLAEMGASLNTQRLVSSALTGTRK